MSGCATENIYLASSLCRNDELATPQVVGCIFFTRAEGIDPTYVPAIPYELEVVALNSSIQNLTSKHADAKTSGSLWRPIEQPVETCGHNLLTTPEPRLYIKARIPISTVNEPTFHGARQFSHLKPNRCLGGARQECFPFPYRNRKGCLNVVR
ncbi:hypothetical protein AGR7B_Cc10406 [Agrobacterium deltaense RV3]|nr:hypothetical protein AGR7B_Cc10406 [Agrobacterium deltaense RV3]